MGDNVVAVVAAALGGPLVGSVAYQQVQARRERQEAKRISRGQVAEAEALRQQLSAQEAVGKESEAFAERRRRQRQAAALSSGRRGTILTGPLGIPGDGAPAQVAGNTLLGT